MAETMVLVTGNTYPVKEQIKALGGRWDAGAKGWRVPATRAAEAQALVAGARRSAPTQSSGDACRCPKCGGRKQPRYRVCYDCSGRTSDGRVNCRKYGWDGVVGSPSYYSSGQYDEDS